MVRVVGVHGGSTRDGSNSSQEGPDSSVDLLVDGMGRWLSVSGADRLMRDGGGEETDTDGWALAVRTEKNRQKQSLLS
jgi:hypothetical protein